MPNYLDLNACRDSYNKYIQLHTRVIADQKPIFIYDWTTIGNRICARGIDSTGSLAMFNLQLKTGLIVMTEQPNLIQELSQLTQIKIVKVEKWDNFNLESVSLTLLDKFNGEEEMKLDHVYLLETESFPDAKRLHKKLVDCIPLNKRIITFGDWTLELFVNLYEFKIRGTTGNIFNSHLNRLLEPIQDPPVVNIPVVSFDVETVSIKDTRVPMGNYATDVLFSLSICTSEGLNLNAFNCPKRYHPHFPKETKLFESEVDLLRFLVEYFINYPTVFFCTGYNVVWYDLSYVIKRIIYYGLDDLIEHLHYSNGMPCIGPKMIVVDLMDIIGKFFREMVKTNMKLKSILSTFLEDVTKVDLDAVKLRYVYADMLNCTDLKLEWPEHDITLEKMVRYNHSDAYGVLEVWKKYDLANFVRHGSQYMNVCMARFAISKVTEYLSTNYLLECFKKGKLFCIFKPKRISAHGGSLLKYDFDQLGAIASTKVDEEHTKYSFGGGFNYRSGMAFHRNVQMMDMVCYYPYLIEGFNLSHENCMILPKKGIEQFASKLFTDEYSILAFCSHKMPDDEGLIIISKLFVDGVLNNVESITKEGQLEHYKSTDRFVVISKTVGILPTVLSQQNKNRSDLKKLTKKLKKLGKLKKKWVESQEQTLTKSDLLVSQGTMFEPCVRIIKDQDLARMSKPIMKWYFETVSTEYDRLFGLFRNLKVSNNSIYGFLYSNYGCVQGKQVASIVTLLGRKYIIESAKASQSMGYQCVFMDTDSIFVKPLNDQAQDPSNIRNALLAINPKLDLNYKTYDDLLVLAKKVYFATSPKGIICRGITRNGPALWEHYMFKLYTDVVKSETYVYGSDIVSFLKLVYQETYDQLKQDRTIILCGQSCKQLNEYQTNTPMKKLLTRYHDEQQTIENPNKMTFWYAHDGAVINTCWKFEHELETVGLQEINLYKFYQKVFKQLYNLFNSKIIITCQRDGYQFYLNPKAYDDLIIRIYLEVRESNTCRI